MRYVRLVLVFFVGLLFLNTLVMADDYKFGVSKPGGAWYPIGTAVARLAEKDYGDKVTLDIGGGMANALNLLGGKIDFGITFGTTVADAMKGRGPFKGKDASDLRLAAVNYPQLMFWVVWATIMAFSKQDRDWICSKELATWAFGPANPSSPTTSGWSSSPTIITA